MKRLILLFFAAFLAIGPTACNDGPSLESDFLVRDSAGVEIVESSAPLRSRDKAWSVSEEPVLQIGAVEGDEPYLFMQISHSQLLGLGALFRTADGRIVVCLARERTVRFFDPTGRFLSQFGRRGEGPGEFRSAPRACLPFARGVAVVESSRVSFFDGDGVFLKRADVVGPSGASIAGIFPDGTLLVRANDPPSPNWIPGVQTQTGTVALQDSTGRMSPWSMEVKIFTSNVVQTDTGYARFDPRMGPSSTLTVLGEHFVYGWGDSYDLHVFDRSGRLRRIIRRGGDLLPLTEADRRRYAGLPVDLPDHYSAFQNAVPDALRHLWVQRPEPPLDPPPQGGTARSPRASGWDVYDPSGRWITTVELPPDLEIHSIGEDYILGVWQDELEVPYVRLYSLDRGGSP